MHPSPPRYPVACEIDGKKYKGNYWITGKILAVSSGKGDTQIESDFLVDYGLSLYASSNIRSSSG